MSSCLVRLVEKGHCPLPSGNWYQPGMILPGPIEPVETEHLACWAQQFYECEFDNFIALGSFSETRGWYIERERQKVISELQT